MQNLHQQATTAEQNVFRDEDSKTRRPEEPKTPAAEWKDEAEELRLFVPYEAPLSGCPAPLTAGRAPPSQPITARLSIQGPAHLLAGLHGYKSTAVPAWSRYVMEPSYWICVTCSEPVATAFSVFRHFISVTITYRNGLPGRAMTG